MAYRSIVRATRGRRAHLRVSLSQTPILADHQIAVSICETYLPESSTIHTDVSKFVANQTTGQLIIPISENQEEDPTSEIESPDTQNEQPVMMTTLSIQHSDHDSSFVIERGESETIAVSIGDEHQSIDLRLTENAVSDIENQIESTTLSMENPENDSSNHPLVASLIGTTPHTVLLHGCSDPKGVSYLLQVIYPILMGLVGGSLTHLFQLIPL